MVQKQGLAAAPSALPQASFHGFKIHPWSPHYPLRQENGVLLAREAVVTAWLPKPQRAGFALRLAHTTSFPNEMM